MIEALGWGWTAFAALWMLGIVPAYVVLDEVMNASMPALLAGIWPLATIVGIVWAFGYKIRDWANKLKAWWQKPCDPHTDFDLRDPEEG